MRNLLTTVSLALLPLFVFSQDKVSEYISNYQHIAIDEMNRSGIPASITLAQGMFESAYGHSPSAIGYNNHFGIKCKKEWTGPYFYKHDDDRDKNGKLIPSCFRAYTSVNESFQDHTNFLVERERYAELFSYAQSDYYNWAIGLERCGYATNKMYGERLVEIIERYALYEYDVEPTFSPLFVSTETSVNSNYAVDELAPVATDAFSSVVSSSSPEVETDPIVVEIPVEQTLTEVIEVVVKEDPFKTIVVLGSFQEFSNVFVAPNEVTKTDATSKTETKKEPAPVSRVNRAIILPANYRRKADVTNSETSSLDKL